MIVIPPPTDPAFIATWSDALLIGMYQMMGGAIDDADVEAVLAEIERRHLDI